MEADKILDKIEKLAKNTKGIVNRTDRNDIGEIDITFESPHKDGEAEIGYVSFDIYTSDDGEEMLFIYTTTLGVDEKIEFKTQEIKNIKMVRERTMVELEYQKVIFLKLITDKSEEKIQLVNYHETEEDATTNH